MTKPLSAIALALTIAARISPAYADPPSADPAARDLYRRSVESYRDGRFAEAAQLSREAYRRAPEPALLYNLARACEGMGDLPCAIDAYEKYLASASPPDRPAIEQRVRMHKKALDDRAAAERAASARPPPKPSAPVAPPPPPAVSPVPWIVAGAGVATMGVGLALFVVARDKHQTAVDDPVQQTAAEEQASYEHLLSADRIVLITGGVIAVGGVVWGLIELGQRHGAPPSPVSVGVGPGSARVTFRF